MLDEFWMSDYTRLEAHDRLMRVVTPIAWDALQRQMPDSHLTYLTPQTVHA
ncbi:MAG: hypothetical protein ACK48C_05300 [Roseiflexaceae bacterium]|jgi:hypothetical protein|nr:hypothetical protein [Chloroflexaceae bacterium]MCE2852724.1 hypothetical protein [Chloroflexaceae bacterium]